jgi:hypothetical protein
MGFVLSGSVVWATAPPINQPSHPEAAQPTANKSEEQEPWLTKDAAGFFTFLLVIVGGFQIGMFGWQLWLIRKSLDETKLAALAAKEAADAAKGQAETAQGTLKAMQDIAKRQLRAYVSVTGIKILFPGGEWQPNIRVTFKNGGQTPAYGVQNRFGCGYGIVGDPSFSDFQESARYSDLGLDQDVTTTSLILQAIWNPFKEALAARAIKFFVFGEINYRDAFGDLHFTRYRFELSPDAEGIKEDAFVFCPEGNESN